MAAAPIAATARAVRYYEHGRPGMLAVETVDRAAPAADELPVRVEAAAVDPVDTSFREGSFLGKPVVEPS